MKKIFKAGEPLENNICYYADRQEYNIYPSDAATLSSADYMGLRGEKNSEFGAFAVIDGKKNIILDFCGATVIFHGKIQPFLVTNSENITIKNCNIMYSRPQYTELEILERGADFIRVRPNKYCTCRVEDGKLIPYGEDWENTNLDFRGCFFQVFDKETGEECGLSLGAIGKKYIPDSTFPYKVTLYCAEQDGEDIILKGDCPDFFQPGRVLEIEHEARNFSGIYAADCKNLKIENFRIISGAGMGIYVFKTENIGIEGYRLFHDEKSPCIATNGADAIHTVACSGDIEIKNSIFEGMIDDGLNVHSNFFSVNKAEKNEITADAVPVDIRAFKTFAEGDSIAVYNGRTMEKSEEYKIIKLEETGERLFRFTVDKPVSEHKKGDLIENISAAANVSIINCRFAKANTHLRLQSRGKIRIAESMFALPVLLTGDADYWFESGPVRDLKIEKCKFIGERANIRIMSKVMPSEKEKYYHKNITILNNEFESDLPLAGGNADGITFKGNINSLGKQMRMELTNCGDVVFDNCKCIRK